MRSLQNKVMKQIDTLAENCGFETVQSSRWANQGTIAIQAEGSFTTLITIGYDFQDSNMTLKLKHRDKHLVAHRQRNRTDGYVDWLIKNDSDVDINEFFDAYKAALKSEVGQVVKKAKIAK